MLVHLGLTAEAEALERAVDRLLAERKVLTPDLGGSARTADVERAILALLG
jgi:isocitrate/isopropylmalate dehydrogenase